MCWWVVVVAGPLLGLLFLALGNRWQQELRARVGLEPMAAYDILRIVGVSVLTFVVLLLIGRSLRLATRRIAAKVTTGAASATRAATPPGHPRALGGHGRPFAQYSHWAYRGWRLFMSSKSSTWRSMYQALAVCRIRIPATVSTRSSRTSP
jgi:hypothetical protein